MNKKHKILKEYENYLKKIEYNTEKIFNEIKSLEDINKFQNTAKYELEKLQNLSTNYKLYDRDYEDYMIAMGKYSIGLTMINDFILGNDKYIAIDVFMKIHTEFEDLQFRNIMKDAYVWK